METISSERRIEVRWIGDEVTERAGLDIFGVVDADIGSMPR